MMSIIKIIVLFIKTSFIYEIIDAKECNENNNKYKCFLYFPINPKNYEQIAIQKQSGLKRKKNKVLIIAHKNNDFCLDILIKIIIASR